MTDVGVSSITAYAAQSDYSKNTKTRQRRIQRMLQARPALLKRNRRRERLEITAGPSVSRSCRRRLRNTMSS